LTDNLINIMLMTLRFVAPCVSTIITCRAMSSKLTFISDHPIIYRAVEYIEQWENNSQCVFVFFSN